MIFYDYFEWEISRIFSVHTIQISKYAYLIFIAVKKIIAISSIR